MKSDFLPLDDMILGLRFLAVLNAEYKMPKTEQTASRIPSTFSISLNSSVDGSNNIGTTVAVLGIC